MTASFGSRPFYMSLYHSGAFRENRMHGSARKVSDIPRRRRILRVFFFINNGGRSKGQRSSVLPKIDSPETNYEHVSDHLESIGSISE